MRGWSFSPWVGFSGRVFPSRGLICYFQDRIRLCTCMCLCVHARVFVHAESADVDISNARSNLTIIKSYMPSHTHTCTITRTRHSRRFDTVIACLCQPDSQSMWNGDIVPCSEILFINTYTSHLFFFGLFPIRGWCNEFLFSMLFCLELLPYVILLSFCVTYPQLGVGLPVFATFPLLHIPPSLRLHVPTTPVSFL